MNATPSSSSGRLNRRRFLKSSSAAGMVAGAAALGRATLDAQAAAAPADPLLPVIKLGRHEVTRLIIGGNPIYGHSHFNRILSQTMTTWHTPERVVELLKHCEARGLNTWQNSYTERTLSDLDRYRAAGGKMNWLCLGKPDWDEHPERINDAAKRKPIGIAPHGALAERLHRTGKLDVLAGLLKRIRDTGVLVGLSAHNPAVIELAEEKGWDVDYYMCCLYYLTRPREEYQKLLGPDLPLGEIYLPGDPPRMFQVIAPQAVSGLQNPPRPAGAWTAPRKCAKALRPPSPTSSLPTPSSSACGNSLATKWARMPGPCGRFARQPAKCGTAHA
jgi:hypothetical protein